MYFNLSFNYFHLYKKVYKYCKLQDNTKELFHEIYGLIKCMYYYFENNNSEFPNIFL